MRGIIAAGGTGSRLAPLTAALNKHLLPVHDKPMIFYPLATLMAAGIREIVIVTSPQSVVQFNQLLGDGRSFGISITYAEQRAPLGVAHVLDCARGAIRNESFAFILGDNFFYGPGLGRRLSDVRPTVGGHIFASRVVNPQDYGVVEFDDHGNAIRIEEKPIRPRSDLAIPGLYFYGSDIWHLLDQLEPSARGEFEISDLNRALLEANRLVVEVLPRGTVWLDAGTVAAMEEASEFVSVVQRRQGLLIGCPEEVALLNSWLTPENLRERALGMGASPYGEYLLSLGGIAPA